MKIRFKSLSYFINKYKSEFSKEDIIKLQEMNPLKLNKKEKLVKKCLNLLVDNILPQVPSSEVLYEILEEGLKTKKIEYLQQLIKDYE